MSDYTDQLELMTNLVKTHCPMLSNMCTIDHEAKAKKILRSIRRKWKMEKK